jgi:hypothetical protein
MDPNSPDNQAAQHHELREVLVGALALVLVVDEVLVGLVAALASQDLVKALGMVPGWELAGQDNLQLHCRISTSPCCTNLHFHLKDSHHKCWHRPRHSNNIQLPKM